MSENKIEKAVEEGFKAKNEIVQDFLTFLASMEEEAELELDGLKLRIGDFLITLKGDIDLKIEAEGEE